MIVRLGNWLFHYRNIYFFIFYLMLFIPSPSIFTDKNCSLIIGAVLIVIGLAIRIVTIGYVYIQRERKNQRIYAKKLIVGGIYKICRNPMYLGNIFLIAGFGVLSNSLWFIIAVFPIFIFIYFAIIKAEENYLLTKFEEKHKKYIKNVNRILPNLLIFKTVTQGLVFKWRKVISKEHNSLFLYLSGILFLLFNERYISFMLFIILFAFLLVVYLTVKALKRAGYLNERIYVHFT